MQVNETPENWHAIVIPTGSPGGTTSPYSGTTKLRAAQVALANYQSA